MPPVPPVPLAAASLRERIDRVADELGPGERQVADFVLEHLAEVAGYSGAELAQASSTSKATVSRFFRRLGYDSFSQARLAARGARAHGVPVGGLPADASDPVGLHLAHETGNLARLAELLTPDRVAQVARLLAGARRVLVVGWRNSHPVAVHLREQLLQARPDVALGPLPGQTVGEELADLGDGDALVVIAFRRRPPVVQTVVDVAGRRGIPVVLVTEPGTLGATGARHRLEVPVDGPGAFDSYAAAMAVAAVLAEAVLAARGRTGQTRVAAISATLDALGELHAR